MLHTTLRRYLSLALALCCLTSVGEPVLAQEARTECGYDMLRPSLEHASDRYGAYDFYCSVREILDFVAIDTITSKRRADGYRLLSMVMYDSLLYTDQEGLKAAVIDAGKQAWKANPEWAGEYEIDAAEYVDWMSEARNLALDELEQERVQAQAEHLSERGLSQEQKEGVGFMGVGIKVGMAFATLSTDVREFGDAGPAAGFTIGAFGTYNITPALAIQPELLYVRKGLGDADLLTSAGFRLSYVEIPLLVKYDLVRTGKTVPRLYLGPAAGALLGADLYYHGLFSDYDHDVKDGMKSVDFCLVFGGEVEIRSVSIGRLMVDMRYSLSLSNSIDPSKWNDAAEVVDEGFLWYDPIGEYDRPHLYDDAYAKNGVFSILVGYRF